MGCTEDPALLGIGSVLWGTGSFLGVGRYTPDPPHLRMRAQGTLAQP